MAKSKIVFYCTNCGQESAKWLGQCYSCSEWNTFKEEIIQQTNKGTIASVGRLSDENLHSKALNDIEIGITQRTSTEDLELDRVLGGGLVTGSVVLIGGQPGIGKSTLLLQFAVNCNQKLLYVSGEESEEQIKMRSQRITGMNEHCYIYTKTDINNIIKEARSVEAEVVIIDSIQTIRTMHIDSSPGSISQIKESTALLQQFAKETGTSVFIIGHITKDGSIAGPKLLEHMVDVVLQFEGDQHHMYRILRSIKNRFGSTDELGLYTMNQDGLQGVPNPSELLISQGNEELSGSAICASVEGQRPILLETQALVSPTVFGHPQRTATGFDLRKLSILLAVLEKRCGLPFGQYDVFMNIAGGLKVTDPAVDLAIVASLISSIQDIAIGHNVSFAGEVGLSGEVRAISRIDQRIQEANRLGFEHIYVPQTNTIKKDNSQDIAIHPVSKVDELIGLIFE